MDYGSNPDLSKAVLVCEHCEQVHRANQRQPYGALVYSPLSSAAVAAQLGHHECFPNGIQICSSRLGGTDLDLHQQHHARDGDLCDLVVKGYPRYVDDAY